MPPIKAELKRLRVTEDVTFQSGEREFPLAKGQVVNVDPDTADELVKAGQAEEYDEATESKELEEQKRERDAEEKEALIEIRDLLKEDQEERRRVRVHDPVIEQDGMGGFKSVAHFLREVVQGSRPGSRPPETLRAWDEFAEKRAKAEGEKQMNTGDDEAGGFLVPADIATTWMPPALEASITTPRAFRVPLTGNRVEIPALVDDDHSQHYFGGVQIARPGEGGQKPQTRPELRMIELRLQKMTVLVPVTDELIEDSAVSMAAFLNTIIPQAIAFQRDDDHINGTGANMALGALNAANPALIAVAPQPAQDPNTIVYENLVNMWARFKMVNRGATTWIASHEAFPQLATMAMVMGTAGVAVWMPAGGAADSPFSTLFGIPLILTEKAQALGVQGDIGLVDWSQYYYADKGGIQAASSIHLWFDFDMTAFRFVLRSDGQPAWNTPLTPLRGNDSLSPFVTLQARP